MDIDAMLLIIARNLVLAGDSDGSGRVIMPISTTRWAFREGFFLELTLMF